MAKAKKLPSGNWRVQAKITIDGKQICKSFTEKTKAKAEYQAELWQNGLKEIKKDTSNMTLSQAIDEYLDLNSAIFSPSTLSGYRKIKRNYFLNIMDFKLNKINNNALQREVNALSKRGLSPKTVVCAFGLIRTVIKRFNPDANININLPQKKKIQYTTPDIKTSTDIIKAIKGTVIETPVLLAILLGLTMSEIRGLKWNAYNGKTLTIQNAIVDTDNGAVETGRTKEYDRQREILLPKQILELLNSAERTNEYIIPYSASSITTRLRTILKRNGIPHVRFHDLRHANASFMLMLGVPDKYAMERGGWSTTNTLKKIYQQTFTSEQQNIADRLQNFYTEELFK